MTVACEPRAPRVFGLPRATICPRAMIATLLVLASADAPCLAGIIHDYELNGSYADSLGGPALAPAGGTLNATNYSFGANQGLSLSSWLTGSATSGNYSIETTFNFSTLSGFRKIIDFKDLTSDNRYTEKSIHVLAARAARFSITKACS